MVDQWFYTDMNCKSSGSGSIMKQPDAGVSPPALGTLTVYQGFQDMNYFLVNYFLVWILVKWQATRQTDRWKVVHIMSRPCISTSVLKKIGLPWAPWCAIQVGAVQHKLMVHNKALWCTPKVPQTQTDVQTNRKVAPWMLILEVKIGQNTVIALFPCNSYGGFMIYRRSSGLWPVDHGARYHCKTMILSVAEGRLWSQFLHLS